MSKLYSLYKPTLDGIMRINQLYNLSKIENKINLVVGAYRTIDNKPFVFNSVKQAKNNIITNNYEYLPITGDIEFNELSKKLYFGNFTNFSAVQTLSGTGSLYLLSQLLREIIQENKTIYLPNPTWDNHFNIFHSSGLNLSTYEYLLEDRKFNFEYLYDNIKKIPESNIVLFHGCAHNPTGYDPMFQGWFELIRLCQRKNLMVIIDMAYLGFASGNIEHDANVLRILNNRDYPAFVCSSYAKNFGLYSERVGNLFFRGYNQTETNDLNDILRTIIRRMYSNPPSNGSNIIKTILGNDELYKLWLDDLQEINHRYSYIRNQLYCKLENEINENFSDIIHQKGMFYYSKLNKEQVGKIRENGIFMPDNGRISLAGLNNKNIDRFVSVYKKVKMT